MPAAALAAPSSVDFPVGAGVSALTAERNRRRILATARTAFAESGAQLSMAEIARRAEVGMATLYRNFPGRYLEPILRAARDGIRPSAPVQ